MNIRYLRTVRYLLGVLLLVGMSMAINGCGAKQQKSTDASGDGALESINHLARSAFEKKMYKQAAGIYQTVLGMAYVRNDSAVILDTRYNLAICLMELERYPDAIKLVNQVREELSIGDEKMPSDFLLLEATIFYRNDRLEDSWEVTENILAVNASLTPTIRAKTSYLRGLISSQRNDIAGIREAIRNIGQSEIMTVKADQMELQGRLAMAENSWNQAVFDFDQVTHLRRENRDYRRMAITLALSATASEKSGRLAAAAGKYLQAGRSAAQREDRSNARKWLSQAALLFGQTGNVALAAESNSFLYGLNDESKPSNLRH